jgi:hypothetical protein
MNYSLHYLENNIPTHIPNNYNYIIRFYSNTDLFELLKLYIDSLLTIQKNSNEFTVYYTDYIMYFSSDNDRLLYLLQFIL